MAEQPGPQAIIDVMGVVGDVVGERGGLRLRRGKLSSQRSCRA